MSCYQPRVGRSRRGEVARVRYIGSKARIADEIVDLIGMREQGDGFFVDAFSGTDVVGGKAGELGWPVRFNDHLQCAVITSSARLLGRDFVPFAPSGGYADAIARLDQIQSGRGFLWREYSPASAKEVGVEQKILHRRECREARRRSCGH